MITRLIWSLLQLPRPVALSEVRLPLGKSPNGVMRISMPPASFIPGRMRLPSSTGEWQRTQPRVSTSCAPRFTGSAFACASRRA